MKNRLAKLVLSAGDYRKLSALVASCELEAVAKLEEEIGRALVVPEEHVPSDVVRMNSRVRVRESDTGSDHEYTLVFPHEANLAENRISVLAPLGVALIGLKLGEEYAFEAPNHRLRYFTVVAIRPAIAA